MRFTQKVFIGIAILSSAAYAQSLGDVARGRESSIRRARSPRCKPKSRTSRPPSASRSTVQDTTLRRPISVPRQKYKRLMICSRNFRSKTRNCRTFRKPRAEPDSAAPSTNPDFCVARAPRPRLPHEDYSVSEQPQFAGGTCAFRKSATRL